MASSNEDVLVPLVDSVTTSPASAAADKHRSLHLNRRRVHLEKIRPSSRPRASSIAPGQPPPHQLQKDRCVPLSDSFHEKPHHHVEPSFAIFQDLEQGDTTSKRGPINVYCVAENLDLHSLHRVVRMRHPSATMTELQDVLHIVLGPPDCPHACDIFCFDYGVVVFWAAEEHVERDVLKTVLQHAAQQELPAAEALIARYQFNYSWARPTMQNDVITVHKPDAHDPQVKLAISHALAQSEKLRISEQRVVALVLATRELPLQLAKRGTVPIGRVRLARMIGELFLQRSAVNLLSSVMDTPEFFWSAPDALQVLYKRVSEYLELDTRLEVLNTRFAVLTEMLDMLRDEQNNHHTARLEWIVIWLILVECIVGFAMVLGEFGLVGKGHSA